MSQFVLEHSIDWYAGLQARIVSQPHLAPLKEVLSAEPWQMRNYSFSRKLHLEAMRKVFFNPDLRYLMLQAIREFVQDDLKLPSVRNNDAESLIGIQQMLDAGHTALGFGNPKQISEM